MLSTKTIPTLKGTPSATSAILNCWRLRSSLKNTGKPSVKISMDSLDEYTMGHLFMLWQFIVPVIGLANDIDPFDQPGVEEGKNYAYGLLDKEGYSDMKKKFEEIFVKRDDFVI